MLKSVIYSNKITVWWKRETFEKINYEIYVNDKFLGGTSSTFYTIKNLKPNIELASYFLVAEFAKIGLGVGYVTKDYVTKEIEKGELKIIDLKVVNVLQ